MRLIYKLLLLIVSLTIINWPVIPTLLNLSTCDSGDRIIICCVGLSLLVPFASAILKYFSKLGKKTLTEEGVGLSFFAMLSGFLLTLVNGINTSRMLTLWFDDTMCLDNYYGKYISILASILTMVNGTTTIVLLQRWLEFIDMFRLSKDSVWLVWGIITGTFGAFGGFMYHYLRKDCEATLNYYTVLFGNLAFFQVLTLIIMLIYLKRGTNMKDSKLARGVTAIYGLGYVPFNFFWLIRGIILLWSPEQKTCLSEHVLFAAILIAYGLTTSPLIFGMLAVPLVYAIWCLIPRQLTIGSRSMRRASDEDSLHGDEAEYRPFGN